MSAYPSWHVVCDVCGEEMDEGHQGNATAASARDEARRLGGHRSKGRDICDECWDGGKR
jgi:hypothetical protein